MEVVLPPRAVSTFRKHSRTEGDKEISTYQVVVRDSCEEVQVGMNTLRGDSPTKDRLYIAVACISHVATQFDIPLDEAMRMVRSQLSESNVSTVLMKNEEPERDEPPPFEDEPEAYDPSNEPLFD